MVGETSVRLRPLIDDVRDAKRGAQGIDHASQMIQISRLQRTVAALREPAGQHAVSPESILPYAGGNRLGPNRGTIQRQASLLPQGIPGGDFDARLLANASSWQSSWRVNRWAGGHHAQVRLNQGFACLPQLPKVRRISRPGNAGKIDT